jgi:hypothetical protein
VHTTKVLKQWGPPRPPGGAISPLEGGASILIGAMLGLNTYFTHRLVPVLAPNYKQHILSPSEVRKIMLIIS